MYSVPKVCYALDRLSPTVTPKNHNDKADLSFSTHPMTLSGDEKKLVSINIGTNASLNASLNMPKVKFMQSTDHERTSLLHLTTFMTVNITLFEPASA